MHPGKRNDGIVRPASIGHFGVRTTPEKYEKMIDWYTTFFGGSVVYRAPGGAFISWDEEHHRCVILVSPEHEHIKNRKTATCFYHIAFTLDSLSDLATSYEQKKAKGIEPHWPVNHGMSTSMYYFDPDGNEIELQVDNFDTVEETYAFMASAEFAENPIGVDIVPQEFVDRVRSGEDEAAIKRRPQIGPRRARWQNSIYFKPEDAYTAGVET